jgi:hypothetical protein
MRLEPPAFRGANFEGIMAPGRGQLKFQSDSKVGRMPAATAAHLRDASALAQGVVEKALQ